MSTVKNSNTRSAVSAAGDPFVSNLATPLNASERSIWYINNLPAYRPGLTSLRRGLEVGMAHGYWMLGPFAKLGPLRDSGMGNFSGLGSTIGLVLIATIALWAYAETNPAAPLTSVTVATIPDTFTSKKGWQEFARGFLIGGAGGAFVAWVLVAVLDIFI